MNQMTLDQLRVFVAVAERQHLTKAAEALHLAQSAVSTTIATLESRHRTKLFHRVGRRIELTEVGGLFVVEARAVLARVAAAELMLSELAGLKRGTLTVQASQTIASYWLPRHLVSFHDLYPGIDIRLTVGNTAQVAAAVRNGTAELGFVEGPVEDPLLTSTPVARDQILIVVGAAHAWAESPDIGPADLTRTQWVMREAGSGTRSVLERALKKFGIVLENVRVALELPSNEAVRAAVEAGLGATALSASVVVPSIEAGLIHAVRLALPDRHFYAVRHTERYHSQVARELLKVIAGPRTNHSKKDAQ
jgi:DNA-binding transcriptional LysR family regulator